MSPAAAPVPEHDAVVLAGGRGTRLGGVDKAALVIGGRSLLRRALEAVSTARGVVVVGEVTVPAGVRRVVEEPPGGGPVAGIEAGLAALDGHPAAWVLVLAVDQPGAQSAIATVLAALEDAEDDIDAIAPDGSGYGPQWLLAAYRRKRLEAALRSLPQTRGASMKALVDGLTFATLTGAGQHLGDVDTWDDAAEWERRLGW